jgi:hypothetical protein
LLKHTSRCGKLMKSHSINIRHKINNRFNYLFSISFLFSFLLLSNFSIAQKFYAGMGVSFNLASNTKIDYNYLSESTYFYEPLRVSKHNQFVATAENMYQFQGAFGLQFNSTFLEFNFAPYYIRTFIFKAEGANFQGGPLEEKKITHRFDCTDIDFRIKRVLTGRKNIRIAGVLGLSNMLTYKKQTQIGTSLQDYDLFDFKRKIHQLALVGFEYIGNNSQNNVVLGLYYEHQLSKFSDKFTNGYLILGFKYFYYHDSKKRQIYVHE